MSKDETKLTPLAEALNEGGVETEEAPVVETVEATQPEETKQEETVENVETQPDEAPTPEEPPKTEPQNWTYAAYSDEKQKRQGLEAELAKIKAQNEALQYQMQQAQQKPQDVPDYLTDPQAYTQHVQQTAQAPVINIVQQQAYQIAELKHGSDKIQSANEWFNTLPPHQQQAINIASQSSPDPWGMLVQEHSKATLAQEFSDPEKLEAFKQWQAAQSAQQPVVTQPQQAPQTPSPANVKLMPSVTDAPNVGKRSGPAWTGPAPIEVALQER